MRPLLRSLLFVILLPVVACAQDWTAVTQKAGESLVRLRYYDDASGGSYSCTGFSISTSGMYLTANHCINPTDDDGTEVDGMPSTVIAKNPDLDLAVLSSEIHKPSLRPAKQVKKAESVAALGYGLDLADWFFRQMFVMTPTVPIRGSNGTWILLDKTPVGGMSGGPIIDAEGNVIAIVQQGDRSGLGFSRPIGEVYKAVKAYWPSR